MDSAPTLSKKSITRRHNKRVKSGITARLVCLLRDNDHAAAKDFAAGHGKMGKDCLASLLSSSRCPIGGRAAGTLGT
jgi:hypothetical protein